MIRLSTTYDSDGAFVEQVDLDPTTGTVIVTTPAGATTTPADPAFLASIEAQAASDARRQRLDTASATLRQWAADAEATTVTNGNNLAVTQTVVDRLGVFFDRFADLLDER